MANRNVSGFTLKFSLLKISTLLTYLVFVVVLTSVLFLVRDSVIESHNQQQDQQWNEWREETIKQAENPKFVERRPAKSTEPPAVVLLRDHFFACWLGITLMSSVIFLTFMFLGLGAFKTNTFGNSNESNRTKKDQ